MKNLKEYIKKEIKFLKEQKVKKRYPMPPEIKDALENKLKMFPLIRFVSNLKAINSIPPSYRIFLLNGKNEINWFCYKKRLSHWGFPFWHSPRNLH